MHISGFVHTNDFSHESTQFYASCPWCFFLMRDCLKVRTIIAHYYNSSHLTHLYDCRLSILPANVAFRNPKSCAKFYSHSALDSKGLKSNRASLNITLWTSSAKLPQLFKKLEKGHFDLLKI